MCMRENDVNRKNIFVCCLFFYAGYTVLDWLVQDCTVLAVRLVSRMVISVWLQEAAVLTATL